MKELKKIARIKHDKNEYNNPSISFSDYPGFARYVDLRLSEFGYIRVTKTEHMTSGYESIEPDMFSLQTHQMSVEEHTDPWGDFGICFLSCRKLVRSGYSQLPVFNYRQGRKKVSKKLSIGDVVVFNPRLPHSLDYFGIEGTLALFSVSKLRNKKGD